MARSVRERPTPSPGPGRPAVPFVSCPIATTLRTLGRKWALTIVRDIAFFPEASFSSILKSNPGLRQRTLSLRLRQLAAEGIVERSAPSNGGKRSGYRLTEKGKELWPVLTSLLQFGVQNHAEEVFADQVPRHLEEVFPHDTELMLGRFAHPIGSGGRAGRNASLNRPSPS